MSSKESFRSTIFCFTATRHLFVRFSTKSIIGLTVTMRTGCRISEGHPRITSIFRSGALRSTMRSLGSNVKTKWTACILTRSSRYSSILSSIRFTIVLTELCPTNSDAMKRKTFARTATATKNEKCIRKSSQKECPASCRKMMGLIGMKTKCMSTQQTVLASNQPI